MRYQYHRAPGLGLRVYRLKDLCLNWKINEN